MNELSIKADIRNTLTLLAHNLIAASAAYQQEFVLLLIQASPTPT